MKFCRKKAVYETNKPKSWVRDNSISEFDTHSQWQTCKAWFFLADLDSSFDDEKVLFCFYIRKISFDVLTLTNIHTRNENVIFIQIKRLIDDPNEKRNNSIKRNGC